MKTTDFQSSVAWLTLTCLFTFSAFQAVLVWCGVDLLPEGPARRMYDVAQSLLQDGRFVPDSFLQVESFLREQTKKDASTMWQDVFSLTHDGRVFPKHSLLSSLVLVPFVALFGIWGVSVVTVLVQSGTVVSIHRVASLLQPGIPWTASLISVLIGTQIFFYSGGVAYDSLGGFLVIAATAIAGSRPVVAGVLVGLAVFCRPVNVLYVVIPCLFSERRRLKPS